MIEEILSEFDEDSIDVTIDPRYPFPIYELDISWKEWCWNDARTARLDATCTQGMYVNPFDYFDEDGNLNSTEMKAAAIHYIKLALAAEDRVGKVSVLA